MFFNGILAISLRSLLVWENRKLDKRYGTVAEQKAQEAVATGNEDVKAETSGSTAGSENYGPKYRYVL